MTRLVVLCSCVLGLVLLTVALTPMSRAATKDPGVASLVTYSMSEPERLAAGALLDLDRGLAPVMSGNPAAQDVIQRAYRLGHGEAVLEREAERRLGVHVVRNGFDWIEKK